MSIQVQKIAVVVGCDNCKEEQIVYVPANKLDEDSIIDELNNESRYQKWKVIKTTRGARISCSAYCDDELSEEYQKDLI